MRPLGEELDLHHLTVDEAFLELDQFLHTAFQAGMSRVWVVHGKGTGVLRQATRSYLAGHPLVKSYSPADRYHGGEGATQVELSEW